jgi:hypothetical protein
MKLRTLQLSFLLLLAAVAAAGSSGDDQTTQSSSSTAASAPAKPTSAPLPGNRESDLAKAVEKQERRHFEMHRFYIPLTQGNLQWLVATVRAKPEEAALVWKLMRDWDGARWTSVVSGSTRNPS